VPKIGEIKTNQSEIPSDYHEENNSMNNDSSKIQNNKNDTAAKEVLKKNDMIPKKSHQPEGSKNSSENLEKQVASKTQPTQNQTMPSDTWPVPTQTPEQQSKNKLTQNACVITLVVLVCVVIALTLYYFLRKAPSKADKQHASVKNSSSDENASQEIQYAEMFQ